jgi:cell division protein FtsZ
MDDEVKITVIATGFRDQMPERRARMLSVEESPVVSVPVVAPDTWLREGAEPPVSSVPAPLRFMSEEEDADPGTSEERETAPISAAGRPKFAEITEEPAYTPLPRDFASDFGNGVRTPVGEAPPVNQAPLSSLSEPSDDPERDLDVPAFMRRVKF